MKRSFTVVVERDPESNWLVGEVVAVLLRLVLVPVEFLPFSHSFLFLRPFLVPLRSLRHLRQLFYLSFLPSLLRCHLLPRVYALPLRMMRVHLVCLLVKRRRSVSPSLSSMVRRTSRAVWEKGSVGHLSAIFLILSDVIRSRRRI